MIDELSKLLAEFKYVIDGSPTRFVISAKSVNQHVVNDGFFLMDVRAQREVSFARALMAHKPRVIKDTGVFF